ncbi:hypothetical protein [Arthrobacter sp. VKM Ac-2550]|uniref:hypothetical protein n=1 Tax=Crystallibacter permensis TaxID=1938888 RepID=UPI002225FB9F|nr:hypothetical protein [Arthrobacter sp. VKM Ac-2550]MCW2131011.1 hypothetical protein [Arthrobacter sp. VKM Ac-2550]
MSGTDYQEHYDGQATAYEAGDRFNDRLALRETRSSRAPAAIIAAVLVSLICLYVLLEAALKAIGQPAWLLEPRDFAAWLNQLPRNVPTLILGTSGVLILFAGLFFFLHGVLPGRLHRHVLPSRRGIAVVDDEVLASSLARRARTRANVTEEQVLVTVSRTLVEVQLRPTSGIPVEESAIQSAVEDELLHSHIDPMPEVRVRVSTSGVVGQ